MTTLKVGRLNAKHLTVLSGVVFALLAAQTFGSRPQAPDDCLVRLEQAIVVTQLPIGAGAESQAGACGGMLRASYGEGARLVSVSPDGAVRVLTGEFHSACDPGISFDAGHMLFAAKRAASDWWNIYEMSADGSEVRQITRDMGNCRCPSYQSTLHTIISPKPWYQLTFVSDAACMVNEYGEGPATALFSCRLDGSAIRRLSFNLSSDFDPFMMSDGRLLFSSWQRARLDQGLLGRIGLFGINIDGADYALFAGHEGRRIKHMPCTTNGDLAVFVEADKVPWDGAGYISCVQLRRPLSTYRQITSESDGLFHTPSPLPNGHILVSRRPHDGSASHGVWCLAPSSGKAQQVFDDPRYHDIQAKVIHPRDEPDGRSSVVTEEDPHGMLYCLNVYTSDFNDPSWLSPGDIKRLRVLEGVPLKTEEAGGVLTNTGTLGSTENETPSAYYPGSTVNGIPPLVQRRILGEIPVEDDGSFQIKVPANTPIELQALDARGLALRTCGWIWAKNHEPRGCIGCHEDAELVPENLFNDALRRPSISLCLPPERRRTVDFRRDVMPIIASKCAPCHKEGQTPLYLDGDVTPTRHSNRRAYFNRSYENLLVSETERTRGNVRWKYVDPGRARTSPLVWRVFDRNTSRPWDGRAACAPGKRMPPAEAEPLNEDEKRTIVQWIDMGAIWDGIPGEDGLTQNQDP